MDYVLGGVAALVTGNVTPNRPKLMKRALTPTKHQPSPNVTPKSEFVEDRSIFLSPNMQKKKAIVKKSPKRIFQNPELENPENGDGNVSLTSPKADKVKKHLKDELEADSSISSQKSPKKKGNYKRESTSTQENNVSITEQNDNENTPKKKKKKLNSESEITENVSTETTDNVSTENNAAAVKSPKKRKQRRKSLADPNTVKENDTNETSNESTPDKSPKKQDNKTNGSVPTEKNKDATDTSDTNTPKKKPTKRERRRRAKARAASASTENKDRESEEPNKENIQKENQVETKKKKNRKRKKSKGQQSIPEKIDTNEPKIAESDNEEETTNKSETKNKEQEANKENQVANKKKKNRNRKKSKGKQNEPEKMDTDEPKPVESENEEEDAKNTVPKSPVNPNAITDKESDSEHESDDEIESENEEINKKVLESEKPEVSSDEEDEEPKKKQKKEAEKKEDDGEDKKGDEEEIKRTLFVGNVPFNPKVKKEMKKIFSKHGQIETIRIRTVPIKDARYTPKLAVIKNELHPERSTVNVYIKYADAESVEKALVENNTVLNENHLRVTRSSSTGVEHDPNMSIFVGNMPYAMEDEAFRAIFEKCGEIKSVRIIRDQKTNAGKGFGYVNFESKDAVELALSLSEEDLTVKNRIMRVKRVTQKAPSKKPVKNNTGQKHSGYKGGNHQPNQQGGGGFNNKANQQRGGFKGNQGNQQGGGFRSGNNDNQQRGGINQGFQQRNGPPSRNNQGNRQRAFAGGNDQQRGRFNNKSGDQKNLSQKDEHGRDGAFRRVMNKRKNQENGGGDAPPNKIQKEMNEPREKKSRKEFVGMTAEKKKKRKFDKGQKKKKALSEILTK